MVRTLVSLREDLMPLRLRGSWEYTWSLIDGPSEESAETFKTSRLVRNRCLGGGS